MARDEREKKVAARETRVVRICAWCRAPLPGGAVRAPAVDAVSHGVCAPCARRLARRVRAANG